MTMKPAVSDLAQKTPTVSSDPVLVSPASSLQSSASSTATADPQLLLEQLKLLDEGPSHFTENESQRLEIQYALRKANTKLEQPFEALNRIYYSYMPIIAIKIGQDHRIFDVLTGTTAKDPIDVPTLSERTGVNPLLLETLLDFLESQCIVELVSTGHYTATKLSDLLASIPAKNQIAVGHDTVTHSMLQLNNLLHLQKSQEPLASHPLRIPFPPPSSVASSPAPPTSFQLAFNTPLNVYEYMAQDAVRSADFFGFMTAQFASLPPWSSVFDFPHEFNIDPIDPEETVFVDIGAGNGVQCKDLCARFPDVKGRVVLQDTDAVIGDLKEKRAQGDQNEMDERIELMPYDYFTEQPVQGARIYYLRQILHNSDDTTCTTILRNQAKAMHSSSSSSPSAASDKKKEKASVLIIDEKVLPEPSVGKLPAEYTSALSLLMVGIFNARERREKYWKRIVEDAGLRIREVRVFTKFGDCAIVCVKD